MSRFSVYPAREVIIVARHDTAGDTRFCHKLEKALLQMLCSPSGIDQDEFRADNGMRLQVIGTPMIEPDEVKPGESAGKPEEMPPALPPAVHLALQTVTDQVDSLDAIHSAVQDGDISEALRLIKIARESLTEHVDTLRGLL